jgi:hypothetical protein
MIPAAKTNKPGTKLCKFGGIKAAPTQPTDEQLAAINTFTRRPFAAEELLVGQLRLCNNAIDRDNERFSEECFDGFVKTIVRKTFLLDHNKYDLSKSAIGKFFAAEIEKTSVDQARMEIDGNLTLPEGKTEVWFLCPWFYIPKAALSEQDLVKIEAGIFDFASIGFRCQQLVSIYGPTGSDTLYWEYRGKSEATEGSLVYLGSQFGASVKTASDEEPPASAGGDLYTQEIPQGGKIAMNEFLKRLLLSLGKAFTDTMTDEQGFAQVKALMDEKDLKITTLTTDLSVRDSQIAELIPLAADGKAFRDDLVTQYVVAKSKLGEVAETPEAQKVVTDVAVTYPIAFLQSEVKTLEKRVFEKFPDTGKLRGSQGENRQTGSEGGEKTWKEKNPLVPDEE